MTCGEYQWIPRSKARTRTLILHEPEQGRVPGVEAHLADLDSLRSGAVPQDVGQECFDSVASRGA